MNLDTYIRIKSSSVDAMNRMPIADTLDYMYVDPSKYADTLTKNVQDTREEMREEDEEKQERPMQIMYDAVYGR